MMVVVVVVWDGMWTCGIAEERGLDLISDTGEKWSERMMVCSSWKCECV